MNIEPKAPTVKGPAAWFTGDVYIDAIHARKAEPSRLACGWVHFTPGARTAWHSHAVGQTLLITEGMALLGTRHGRVIVAWPGQVVYTPSGEEHWHGATPENFMAHIALYEGTEDGDGATWLEHVTGEQYAAAATAITGTG
jgi:quercetin dioxygenase-like cupin family protein